MTKSKKTIVYVIPTYNEKENIYKMLQSVSLILKRLTKYNSKILVVDDNSPDRTGDIVKQFIKKHSGVKLLSGKKQGLGSAMIRGYNFAIRNLKADIVITNEADFSYSPSHVPFMIQKIEDGFDIVTAKRIINKDWTITRRTIHYIANVFFAHWVSGIKGLEDHNSAFKALRVKGVLDKINFEEFPRGFAFFNYLNFRLLKITPKFYQLETIYRPRKKGQSKVGLRYFKSFVRDSFEYIKVCLQIRKER